MNNSPTPSRNLWPTAIIAFFIVFVLFIASFIVWAVRQNQDLVSENYYENEVRYQQQLDRVKRTQSLATQTAITFDAARRLILIALPAGQAQTATGRIRFYRPSNARLDHDVPMTLNAEGVQSVDATLLAAGLWKIRVEWSANGQDYFFDQPVVVN